jgi:hypothetical protein
MDFLFHRPFARTPTTMHTNLLDADDTLNAKCPAQLASETIGPLFVGFTVCAAYVQYFLVLCFWSLTSPRLGSLG